MVSHPRPLILGMRATARVVAMAPHPGRPWVVAAAAPLRADTSSFAIADDWLMQTTQAAYGRPRKIVRTLQGRDRLVPGVFLGGGGLISWRLTSISAMPRRWELPPPPSVMRMCYGLRGHQRLIAYK
jgi:hypothetical protein